VVDVVFGDSVTFDVAVIIEPEIHSGFDVVVIFHVAGRVPERFDAF
jgi:hypothetical protein